MLIPALGTIGGGVAILLLPPVDDRWMDALLGFTGGIMLAAACFSLLVPALAAGAPGEVAAGAAAGRALVPFPGAARGPRTRPVHRSTRADRRLLLGEASRRAHTAPHTPGEWGTLR